MTKELRRVTDTTINSPHVLIVFGIPRFGDESNVDTVHDTNVEVGKIPIINSNTFGVGHD